MSVLFCKFLHNENSDPQSTRVVNMRAPILLRVRAFTTRVHAFVHGSFVAEIFANICLFLIFNVFSQIFKIQALQFINL